MMRHSKLTRWLPVLMGGGAQMDPELAALLTNMTADVSGTNVAFLLKPGSPAFYYLARPVAEGLCIGYGIGTTTSFDTGQVAPSTWHIEQFIAVTAVDNAEMTESGDFSSASNVVYYGGVRRGSISAGAYVEYTTPTNTFEVGGFIPTTPNGGIILVTIDGSKTAATLLRTAQDLVTAGELDASALVAGGGTLNPTDRVINQSTELKAGTTLPYNWLRFVSDLAPGAHTVRMTRTGYKDPAANNTYLYVDALFYRVTGVGIPDTAAMLLSLGLITNANSRWEYAIAYEPDAGDGYEFMGHSNTEYNRIAPVISVDGTPTAEPTTYVPLVGKTIKVDVDGYLRHTDTGATDVGLVLRSYTLTATELKNTHQITWQVDGTATVAYPGMLPSDATLDRGSMVGADVDYTLTADDNSSTAQVESQAGYLWDADGNWAMAVYIPNLSTVLNYAATNCGMYISDRDDGINKIYFERNDLGAVDIAPNDVWTADVRFLANYFPDGAEGTLARPA